MNAIQQKTRFEAETRRIEKRAGRAHMKALEKHFGSINAGDLLRCHETGKEFIAKQEGISYNYAKDSQGFVYSDEGVDIQERRTFFENWPVRKPVYCYLSDDGKRVTGWKGNELGKVTWSSTSRTGRRNSSITHVNVIDTHGNPWHGKGAGAGVCITLRPSKKAAP
jgi:hypothetical protein